MTDPAPGQPVETILSSGAKLVVTRAPYTLAMALHNSILKAMGGSLAGVDFLNSDMTVLVIQAATSEDVSGNLLKCFARCTYQDLKVNADLFDDPRPEISDKAREDYYQIAYEVWRVNCSPFLKRIPSWLKAAIESMKAASRESASGSTTV